MFSIRHVDLDRLNSLTKYPSIPTYHKLGERGALTDECEPFAGRVLITEKIDGTNSRVLVTPDDGVVIGSREEFLWAVGDLIVNPAQGIVPVLRRFAEDVAPRMMAADRIAVLYFEVYGGNINAARQYTGAKVFGFRLFDICLVRDYAELLAREVHAISSWREHGGQSWESVDSLREWAAKLNVDTVPLIAETEGQGLPMGLEDTKQWLESLGDSRCTLDALAGGQPEGVVIRTPDRSRIAKLRREDYARTLRKRR